MRSALRRKSRNDRGFALIVVLWAIGVMAIFAAVFAKRLHTETLLARNQLLLAQAEAVADGGVLVMASHLTAIRQSLSPVRAPFGPTYVAAMYCHVGGIELAVLVEDEGGKVDLNTASDAVLLRLFTGLGLRSTESGRLVDRIVDFRDGDDLKRLNGAESRDYRLNSKPPPKNAPFESVDELEQVLHVSDAILGRAKPFLTVTSRSSGLDPEVADQRLLAALARDSETTDRADANDEVASDTMLPSEFIARSARRNFKLWAIARQASGATFVRVASVELIDRPAKPFNLLAWSIALGASATEAANYAFQRASASDQDCDDAVAN